MVEDAREEEERFRKELPAAREREKEALMLKKPEFGDRGLSLASIGKILKRCNDSNKNDNSNNNKVELKREKI